jgi:peptidoglycan/LPS O-acetylase OafA/YrhL
VAGIGDSFGIERRRATAYRPELDGVRAIAVLAVMLFHVNRAWGFELRGGFLGVDVFFVLSGYLITSLLVGERMARGRIRLRSFYARRALRLLPALFVMLVLAWFVESHLRAHVGTRPYSQSALYSLTYIANWAQAHATLGVLAHTWSLSIEEQYYLVWPVCLIVVLALVRSKRTIAAMLFLGAAAVAGFRFIEFAHGHAAFAALSTVTRIDGVLIGSALALVLADPPEVFRRVLARREVIPLATGALAVGLVTLRWNSPNLFRGGLFLLDLCTAAIVGHLVVCEHSRARSVLSIQPLAAIGRISYGLYLFHIPVYYLVFGFPRTLHGPTVVAAAFALTFAVATLSYAFVERPALHFKARFERERLDQRPQVTARWSSVSRRAASLA